MPPSYHAVATAQRKKLDGSIRFGRRCICIPSTTATSLPMNPASTRHSSIARPVSRPRIRRDACARRDGDLHHELRGAVDGRRHHRCRHAGRRALHRNDRRHAQFRHDDMGVRRHGQRRSRECRRTGKRGRPGQRDRWKRQRGRHRQGGEFLQHADTDGFRHVHREFKPSPGLGPVNGRSLAGLVRRCLQPETVRQRLAESGR